MHIYFIVIALHNQYILIAENNYRPGEFGSHIHSRHSLKKAAKKKSGNIAKTSVTNLGFKPRFLIKND
jgi:hypothetical protein